MNYSFSNLLSQYSKHLERYFSSISETEEDLDYLANDFHELLVSALADYGDSMTDNSSKVSGFSGNQVSRMIYPLIAAEKEASAEADLCATIRKHFHPSWFDKNSDSCNRDYPSEVADAIAKTCPS